MDAWWTFPVVAGMPLEMGAASPLGGFTVNELQTKAFWAKVEKNGPLTKSNTGELTPCWIWTATRQDGYGMFRCDLGAGYKGHRAHRVAWLLLRGSLPLLDEQGRKLILLHSCDNHSCVNADPVVGHLSLGTHADNSADMALKGRASQGPSHWTRQEPTLRLKGELIGTSKISEETARFIKLTMLARDATRDRKGGVNANKLAKQFGVTRQLVWMIVDGKAWSHIEITPEQIARERERTPEAWDRRDSNATAKLTVETVARIKGEYIAERAGELTRLAEKYLLPLSTVGNIVYGRAWQHVEVPLGSMPSTDPERGEHRASGEHHPNAKLTEAQVAEIKTRFAAGDSAKAISDSMSLAYNTVYDVCTGKTWRNVMGTD